MKNQKGIALVKVMMVSALLASLSALLLNFTKYLSKETKRGQENYEIENITNTIASTLLNSASCVKTLGHGEIIDEGKLIAGIKNRRGQFIIKQLDKYGNGQLTIKSLQIINFTKSVMASGNYSSNADLEIEITKNSSLIKGNRNITKKFSLDMELDSSSKLIKCFSSHEEAIMKSLEKSCEDNGGSFDAASKVCTRKYYDPITNPANEKDVVTTMYLESFEKNSLEDLYVNTEGDTMTGSLESSNGFCINGNCRKTFSPQVCGSGKVGNKINTDGTVECVSVTCPDSKTFYVGLRPDGTAHCKAFPTNTCTEKQYIAKVNDDGSVQCRNLPEKTDKDCRTVNGKVGAIGRIDENGNHTCVELPNNYGKTCPNGTLFQGWQTNGAPSCYVPNPLIGRDCRWAAPVNQNSENWAYSYCASGEHRIGKRMRVSTSKGWFYQEDTEGRAGVKRSNVNTSYFVQARCCTYKFRMRDNR